MDPKLDEGDTCVYADLPETDLGAEITKVTSPFPQPQ